MNAPTPTDPSWPAETGMTAGVRAALWHTLWQGILLPFRVVWAFLTAGRQQRHIRRCVEQSTRTTPR